MSGTVVWGTCTPTQYFLECLPKLRAEYRVDYRIKGGIKISQPEEEAEHIIIDTIFTKGVDKRYHKKWKPAYYESSCHYCQRFGRLFFTFCFKWNMFLLLFWFSSFFWSGKGSKIICLTSHAWMMNGSIFVSGTGIYPRCGLKFSTLWRRWFICFILWLSIYFCYQFVFLMT